LTHEVYGDFSTPEMTQMYERAFFRSIASRKKGLVGTKIKRNVFAHAFIVLGFGAFYAFKEI